MAEPLRLPSLDGVRAVCIALVLGAHASGSLNFPAAWTTWAAYTANGPLGVTVFFVLSGFLITLLLIREEAEFGRVSLGAFYLRRLVRIVPVYLAFLGVLAVLDAVTALDIGACRYVTALTYTKDFGCGGWIEGHLWSLSVEEQFYLAWPPVLAFLPRQWRWIIALAVVAAGPVFRVVFYLAGASFLLQFSFMTNADALAVGCLAALLLDRYRGRSLAVVAYRPAAMRLLAVATMYAFWVVSMLGRLGPITVPFARTAQASAAAYLIASLATVERGPAFRALNLRPVRYVGALSYSLYIWQQPFFTHDNIFGYRTAPAILTFPVNVLAAFAVAVVSYHALEMPLVAVRKRLRPRERDRLAGAANTSPPPAAPIAGSMIGH